MSSRSGPSPKVAALVASRGGLDALSRVLAPLPAGFPAPVIALQHVSPDHESMLADILAPRTALEVHAACDGGSLTAGVVQVAPPGRHVLVLPDRTIRLVASGALPPNRPSADLLLTSMAVSLGADAIAVVLSGAGRDGATGATAVHHLGGTVIVSDEASTEVFSMPREAIGREGVTDHVVDLDRIPSLLESLVA
jgi:two-component system, chemotaxis family, protein-glutamate methylesterase/glutaminase